MTPEERAEKIAYEVGCDSCNEGLSRKERESLKAAIAAEIRAAVEEGCADKSHVTRGQFGDYAKQVRIATYEDAAKIADQLFHEAGNLSVDATQPALSLINERMRIARDLASAIRARAAEVGNGH